MRLNRTVKLAILFLFWLNFFLESWTVYNIGAEVAFSVAVLKIDVNGPTIFLSEIVLLYALFVCVPCMKRCSIIGLKRGGEWQLRPGMRGPIVPRALGNFNSFSPRPTDFNMLFSNALVF